MKTDMFPYDNSRVRFTDMQGVQREGIYKKDSNGYVEISEVEMPEESKFLYPENEIISWEYMEDNDVDMTKFVL